MCFKSFPSQTLNNSLNEPDKLPAHIIRTWGRLNIKDNPLWEYDCGNAFAMARAANAIILTANRQTNVIEVLDINTGKRVWSQMLTTPPLSWGLIVDRDGRIIVTLKDGQILCYGQKTGDYEL